MSLQVGILTLYVGPRRQIEERKFLAACIREGVKIGVDVIVFTPEDVIHRSKQVKAHVYHVTQRRWVRAMRPLPRIIFDRCRFQATPRFAQMRAFRRRYPDLLYLNHPLANKWLVHEQLRRHPQLTRYIPETKLFRSIQDLSEMSNRHSALYIKPINGTGGRGIMRLRCQANGLCSVEGRDHHRNVMAGRRGNKGPLLLWIKQRCLPGNYLIQQGIDIRLPNGSVHDYRIVVQKDGNGRWSLTGGAARVGRSGSITSNLHGGGRAVVMRDMLRKQFSEQKTNAMIDEFRSLSIRIAEHMEKRYGRLCELGLDIAVDRNGHPWLLEINPKPAREIFSKTGQTNTYLAAVRKPLEFARWLSRS